MLFTSFTVSKDVLTTSFFILFTDIQPTNSTAYFVQIPESYYMNAVSVML